MAENIIEQSSRGNLLRIACIQIDSKLGEVQKNVETVKRLTKDLQKGSVDLIILPEMALSGYIFESAEEIEPFLESPSKGGKASPSMALAMELAKRLKCYVCIGFPCDGKEFITEEKKIDQNLYQISKPFDARLKEFCPTNWPKREAFNSSLLMNENGEILHIFRKHFNYSNDKIWSKEGPGFECIRNVPILGNVCIAICMDINPYDFQAPFDAYELARFCRREEIDTLLMNIAWLKSDVDDDLDNDKNERRDSEKVPNSSLQHMNYLANRLLPLFVDDDLDKEQVLPPRKPIRFITCNRTGIEAGAHFVGTSFAMKIEYPSKPIITEFMDQNEGIKILTI